MSRDYWSDAWLDARDATIKAASARIAELEAQRAELLASLREAIEAVEGCYQPADDDDPAPVGLSRWRAAIRRAEGGAK